LFILTDKDFKCEYIFVLKKECEEYSDLFLVKWKNTKLIKEGNQINQNDYLSKIANFSDDNRSFIIKRDFLDTGNI